jgi:hypothetical protein
MIGVSPIFCDPLNKGEKAAILWRCLPGKQRQHDSERAKREAEAQVSLDPRLSNAFSAAPPIPLTTCCSKVLRASVETS